MRHYRDAFNGKRILDASRTEGGHGNGPRGSRISDCWWAMRRAVGRYSADWSAGGLLLGSLFRRQTAPETRQRCSPLARRDPRGCGCRRVGRGRRAPGPLEMFETIINLKPESEWRTGVTVDSLVAEMDKELRLPGINNAWTMPIKARLTRAVRRSSHPFRTPRPGAPYSASSLYTWGTWPSAPAVLGRAASGPEPAPAWRRPCAFGHRPCHPRQAPVGHWARLAYQASRSRPSASWAA